MHGTIMNKIILIILQIYTELVAREVQLREGQNHRLLIPQLLLCFYDQLAPNSIALLAELARIPQVHMKKH
jgi:hypothetical protein